MHGYVQEGLSIGRAYDIPQEVVTGTKRCVSRCRGVIVMGEVKRYLERCDSCQ